MFVSRSSSSAGMFVIESYCRLSFEFSDNTGNRDWWWYLKLKMNMVSHKVTFKLLYLHLFEKSIEDSSELYFEFPVYNLLTVFWTEYYVVGTICICYMWHMWVEKRLQYIKIPLQFLSVGNIVTFFLFYCRNAIGFWVPPGKARGLIHKKLSQKNNYFLYFLLHLYHHHLTLCTEALRRSPCPDTTGRDRCHVPISTHPIDVFAECERRNDGERPHLSSMRVTWDDEIDRIFLESAMESWLVFEENCWFSYFEIEHI